MIEPKSDAMLKTLLAKALLLQAIAYGFLDFFTKVVFGWVLMLSLKPVHDASNG